MRKVVFQIRKEKLSQEILMDWADTVLGEPLLKYVEIQAYNKYKHKGEGFGISARRLESHKTGSLPWLNQNWGR